MCQCQILLNYSEAGWSVPRTALVSRAAYVTIVRPCVCDGGQGQLGVADSGGVKGGVLPRHICVEVDRGTPTPPPVSAGDLGGSFKNEMSMIVSRGRLGYTFGPDLLSLCFLGFFV